MAFLVFLKHAILPQSQPLYLFSLLPGILLPHIFILLTTLIICCLCSNVISLEKPLIVLFDKSVPNFNIIQFINSGFVFFVLVSAHSTTIIFYHFTLPDFHCSSYQQLKLYHLFVYYLPSTWDHNFHEKGVLSALFFHKSSSPSVILAYWRCSKEFCWRNQINKFYIFMKLHYHKVCGGLFSY